MSDHTMSPTTLDREDSRPSLRDKNAWPGLSPFHKPKTDSFNELAIIDAEALEEGVRVVRTLYEALRSRDAATAQSILAADLEWWFHGPPSHQFLMRLLTGTSPSPDSFDFIPDSITSFGSTVLSEGCDPSRSISWVHAWTVSDGIITQVKEYFNTSLTVTRIGDTSTSSKSSSSSSTSSSASSISSTRSIRNWPPVWESSLSSQVGKSVPGLVLAL